MEINNILKKITFKIQK